MFPVESLTEVVVLKLFSRKRRMVCQNTLFAYEYLESNRQPKSSQERSLDISSAGAAAFCASEYWDCKLDDDLFYNRALKASFFARIASLTSWFHQDVLFSLSATILSRFCTQFSIIAVRNYDHFASMFSETSKSCQNFFVMLDANCFLTSLFVNASNLIL